jgi:hypothetical protein
MTEKKPEKKKRKPPFKFDLEQIESLSARGMTKQQIADYLGCHIDTIMDHQKKNPAMLKAFQVGLAKAVAAAGGRLMKHISDGNVTALIFFLKCRAGWKETTVIENVDVQPMPEDDCTNEQAEAAYIAFMRRFQ